jgi:hypothetical protein
MRVNSGKTMSKILYQTVCIGLRTIQTKNIRKTYAIALKRMIAEFHISKPADNSAGYIAYNSIGQSTRMKIKTGRFLSSKLNLTGIFSDKVIMNISEKFNSVVFPNKIVRIDKGYDIVKNYRNRVGGGSCMAGSNSDYTRMYADNEDTYSQLIMSDATNTARAMLVKLDNGDTLLDRIYVDGSSSLRSDVIEYAKNNGYVVRENGGFYKDGEIYSTEYLITKPLIFENGYIPYQDTLYCGTIIKDKMILSHSRGDIDLCITDGCINQGYRCCNCGGRVCRDDIYSAGGDMYCSNCYHEIYCDCECCGGTVLQDEIIAVHGGDVDYVCERCASRRYTLCERCDEYHAETYELDGEQYCERCFEDLCVKCDCCDSEVHTNNAKIVDGKTLCEDCEDKAQCTDCEDWYDADSLVDGLCSDCAVETMSNVEKESNE